MHKQNHAGKMTVELTDILHVAGEKRHTYCCEAEMIGAGQLERAQTQGRS